jgi:hypothetical protein
MNTTARPSRVRFISGTTAERIQARRDAAVLAAHREIRRLESDLTALQISIRFPGH